MLSLLVRLEMHCLVSAVLRNPDCRLVHQLAQQPTMCRTSGATFYSD